MIQHREEIVRYNVTGVAKFASEMAEKGLNKPKVSLQFELSTSGITKLVKAEAAVEEIVIIKEEVEVEEADETEDDKDSKAEETAESKEGEETEEKKEGEEASDESKKEPKDKKKKTKTVEKVNKQMRITLLTLTSTLFS